MCSLYLLGFAGFGGVFTFSCRWERIYFYWLTALEITYSTFNVVNTVILRRLYDFSLLIHTYIQYRQVTVIVLHICKTFQITHIKLYNFNVKATTSEKLSFSKIVCIEWKCSDVTYIIITVSKSDCLFFFRCFGYFTFTWISKQF